MDQALAPINLTYLLVLQIPVYRDASGTRWLDRLWYKDLIEHVEYIDHFTLACPCIEVREAPPGTVRVDDRRVRWVDLPGRHKLTLKLPVTMMKLWRAVGQARVVHTGLGGWLPISIANMTSFMARLRRRFLLVVVESSPWRLVPGRPASALARLKAALAEWMNRRCLDSVDLAVFTQAKYKESLMLHRPDRGYIIHASWIDAAVIVSSQEAQRCWSGKLSASPPRLRILFAGRVMAAKGVLVLLAAARALDARGRDIELHVMGQGDLLDACREARDSLRHVKLELLDPLPYGPAFFSAVRSYHAVVVPSVSDEQPRIVYDAYSQAVPVLASDTDGLRDCITDGVTGKLCKANDPVALAELIEWAAAHPDSLAAMGPACLGRARLMTHQHMHHQRWVLLDRYLSAVRT
jgi:glycosyltransferase involved in cell wall biosynthesis